MNSIFFLDTDIQFIYRFRSIVGPLLALNIEHTKLSRKKKAAFVPALETGENLRMQLQDFLTKNRSNIIKKWRGVIVASYPEGTQRFLAKEKSRFANPVGHVIDREIETLYDEVVKGEDLQKIASCLDNIIRIRAVQDFKPSHAIAFVLGLKKLVREEVEENLEENGLRGDLHAFETRVDDVALLAFDVFSNCREKIHEIRFKEVKNQVGGLLRRANLVCEIPETETDL